MSQALLDELKRENLCTHFILPLLKINKVSFAPLGFVNSYITKDRKRIAVEVMDLSLISRKLLIHPHFSAIYKYNDGYLIMFRLANNWTDDVRLFCEGKYSQFTGKAKEAIIRYSGLPYHKKEDRGTRIVTDGRLLALEKHKALKGMWERELFTQTGKAADDPELHLPDEYLSVPGEESYINPEGLTRIRETQL